MRIHTLRTFRAAAVACVLSTLLIIMYFLRNDKFTFDSPIIPKNNVILFPVSFQEDIGDFVSHNFHNPHEEMKAMKAKKTNDLEFQKSQDYHDHPITVYNSAKDILGKLSRCTNELLEQFKVRISGAQSLQEDLKPILQMILNEIDSGNNHYARMLSPFILDFLRDRLNDGTYSRHWFKFSGSSVFLKEYGVHYAVSRLVFSPAGRRNDPVLSLVYAQLYDTNWKEVQSSLVVPTNDVDFETNEDTFENHRRHAILNFPQIIPVPFMDDVTGTDNKYFGIEDAHVSLVKNEAGYEEPMLVYNSLHKKFYKNINHGVADEDDLKDENTRGMFMAFPFQFQRGKANVDGVKKPQYDKLLYTKAFELREKGKPRSKKQKNWVPLIDLEERERFGFDRNIYMVFSWHKLVVLKCDLQGFCDRDYEMKSDETKTGALRGGTQLVNVNELVQNTRIFPLIPEGRQIWAGFPRAHIDKCGCGSVMYRPNFAVLIKDTDQNGKRLYKVSHVSSSVGFDLPVTGWDLTQPKNVCEGGPNVLLSNGISSWNVESLEKKDGRWSSKDYMTLTLTIGDFTIHAVHIEGLLDSILQFTGPSLYNSTKPMLLPGSSNSEDLVGFNSDNVECAMQSSKDFCMDYGARFSEDTKANQDDLDKFLAGAMVPNFSS